MQIKDLGEFGVIDLLTTMVVEQRSGPDNGAEFGFQLEVDTGDDTAAWKSGQATELFTTDTMVEGVHFTRQTTPWRDLGWKSMASNISDVASMGGLPLYALVTLGLPPETEISDVEELYRGMLDINNAYGVAIIGGDMVRSPVVFITVGLTGLCEGRPMTRSSAQAGDLIAVTGYLGGSGGGLKLMLEHEHTESGAYGQDQGGQVPNPPQRAVSAEATEYLLRCHRRPQPAVAQGRILLEAGVATAMDISDGLADDLGKLCRSSGLSARLISQKIPAHPLLKQAFPKDWLELALNGGEDYQLLVLAKSAVMEQVLPRLPGPATVVGEVLEGPPGRVTIVSEDGLESVAQPVGWDHFA